jgi:hypothetical protein
VVCGGGPGFVWMSPLRRMNMQLCHNSMMVSVRVDVSILRGWYFDFGCFVASVVWVSIL